MPKAGLATVNVQRPSGEVMRYDPSSSVAPFTLSPPQVMVIAPPLRPAPLKKIEP